MDQTPPATAAASVSASVSASDDLRDRLLRLGLEAGLAAVGVAPAARQQPAHSVLVNRKDQGLAGAMQFTYRNTDRSTDPLRCLPSAKSLIVGALRYGSTDETNDRDEQPRTEVDDGPPQTGGRLRARVARYARDNSYQLLAQALASIADELTSAGYRAVVVADSNHLVDRNAAWDAGLGWYGKNANLLVPGVGSWVVLGSVITDADLETTGPPMTDQCGRCQACITGCPTDAIVAPGIVDATRCIAWLVQAAEPIPVELRSAVGDRIYGCDECQEVCPIGSGDVAGPGEKPVIESSFPDLVWILTASDSELLDLYGHWYIAGRDPDVIRRTALVVLGNVATRAQADDVSPLLSRYLTSSSTLLVCHAIWAARQLAMTNLIPQQVWQSDDPAVRSELEGLQAS